MALSNAARQAAYRARRRKETEETVTGAITPPVTDSAADVTELLRKLESAKEIARRAANKARLLAVENERLRAQLREATEASIKMEMVMSPAVETYLSNLEKIKHIKTDAELKLFVEEKKKLGEIKYSNDDLREIRKYKDSMKKSDDKKAKEERLNRENELYKFRIEQEKKQKEKERAETEAMLAPLFADINNMPDNPTEEDWEIFNSTIVDADERKNAQ